MRKSTSAGFGVCLVVGMVLMMANGVQAQSVVVSGSGSGAFDVPGQVNGTVAFGQCTIDRTAETMTCSARLYNIVDLTAQHIHVGGPGVSGPVVIPIPTTSPNPPLRVSGTFGQSWVWTAADFTPNPAVGLTSFDSFMQACAAGNCYLNWHTTGSPGGAVRAQLCPASRTANTVNGIAICTAP